MFAILTDFDHYFLNISQAVTHLSNTLRASFHYSVLTIIKSSRQKSHRTRRDESRPLAPNHDFEVGASWHLSRDVLPCSSRECTALRGISFSINDVPSSSCREVSSTLLFLMRGISTAVELVSSTSRKRKLADFNVLGPVSVPKPTMSILAVGTYSSSTLEWIQRHTEERSCASGSAR